MEDFEDEIDELDADEAIELRDSHHSSHHKNGSGWISFIVIIIVILGISSLFKKDDPIIQEHPNYETYKETRDCNILEPENTYDEGSGHYAGFEWGENGNSCNGNSESFIEGCEDYEMQADAYEVCLDEQN